MKILMAAAEFRGLAKAGGLGDVVRDLSVHLRARGHQVRVIMPCYDSIGSPGDQLFGMEIPFENGFQTVRVRRVYQQGVEVWLLQASFFQGEYGTIYLDSSLRNLGPFEDDGRRFAFFCAGIFELVQRGYLEDDWIWHLHDWHTGLLPLFFALETRLKRPPLLFTIHNLDYQGLRPWVADSRPGESFEQWFPHLLPPLASSPVFEEVSDPRYPECFNPLKTGIALADLVNTVSPTYAQEITHTDDKGTGFVGGRGLEKDLYRRSRTGQLVGILNGVDYPAEVLDRSEDKAALLEKLETLLLELRARKPGAFPNAEVALDHFPIFRERALEGPLVLAVTRAVDQKLGILMERSDTGDLVWQRMIQKPGVFLIIGMGELAPRLAALNRYDQALFLEVFSPEAAEILYSAADLFLMPSDFEPCGISQILAMAHGCPVLAHDRGGLHDTVREGETGFLFSGAHRADTIRAFLGALDRALSLWKDPEAWTALRRRTLAARFDWEGPVSAYETLYTRLLEG